MRKLPLLSLVIANLIPIYGVLFYNWNLTTVPFLYWAEVVIVGLYFIPKTYLAVKYGGLTWEIPTKLSKNVQQIISQVFVLSFFIFYFLILAALHYSIVVKLFGIPDVDSYILFAITIFVISHGISFFTNYIGNREYEKIYVNEDNVFALHMRRVWLVQIVVIGGGLIAMEKSSSSMIILVSLVIKMILDVHTHYQEHKKLGSYST